MQAFQLNPLTQPFLQMTTTHVKSFKGFLQERDKKLTVSRTTGHQILSFMLPLFQQQRNNSCYSSNNNTTTYQSAHKHKTFPKNMSTIHEITSCHSFSNNKKIHLYNHEHKNSCQPICAITSQQHDRTRESIYSPTPATRHVDLLMQNISNTFIRTITSPTTHVNSLMNARKRQTGEMKWY